MFHCLIVRKGFVDMDFHEDMDEARHKHYAMLVKAKVKYFCAGAANKAYHFRVDPLPCRYKKADEVTFKIAGAQLKNELGLDTLKTLFTRDSKSTVGIQVADMLLGAAMSDWQNEATAGPKLDIRTALAEHLGWPDLRADTALREWKFNIWYFHDPTTGVPRESRTRPVKLKVPMPTFRLRGSYMR
jgi:hypothetical protein